MHATLFFVDGGIYCDIIPYKKKQAEEKTKVVAAVWGDVLECSTITSSKDDLKQSFCKNIHFGRGVVWCGLA